MATPREEAFASLAEGIIKKLNERNIEGYYFDNSKACIDKILSMIPDGSMVSWGGSASVIESGMMDALHNNKFELIDRSTAKTPEEQRITFAKTVMSDYYFMSTNALTMDGELMNIDGSGNRTACLIHGPEHIMMMVGRNKIVEDITYAKSRICNIASPANAKRLKRKTPCNYNGRCNDCFSPDCMCNQIVITRRSGRPGRIKVFLINEELGY